MSDAAHRTIPALPGSPRAAIELVGVLCVATGFLVGTVVGALAYSVADLWCLLVPVALIFSLVIWSLQSPQFAHGT